MNILITTGIYPPKIGGPAQYAKNLKDVYERKGHTVSIKTFMVENYLPLGIRHIFFFLKIIPAFFRADMILTLDTYSVGFPTVFASFVFRKKVIIRTGGDFLWEQYVERTGKKVLFSEFYKTERRHFSLKERIIFVVTRWTLRNASRIVFSTEWQRNIFVSAYDMYFSRTLIIENYYGEKAGEFPAIGKEFVASARNLKWKNLDMLLNFFQNTEATLFTENLPFSEFMKKIQYSHAVILVSLGDISPNLILDAIRNNKPFICTKEVGIYDRIKDAGTFVDPLNENEIREAVLKLLEPQEYEKAKERVKNFTFVHTWEDIAEEFLKVV